jgi:hypothetical protein
MATYHAIAAVGGAVLRLLDDSCPRGEFPAAQFDMIQAGAYQGVPMKEGVTLFMYRVTVNASLRNRAPRTTVDGRRYRPALPLDVYYLMTPWAETPILQQRLLGWAMRTLEDHAILSSGLLNHAGPEHDTFGPSEAVELIHEPLSVIDLATVWEAIRASWQLSVAYVARPVSLDSDVELVEGARVQTRAFTVGTAAGGTS